MDFTTTEVLPIFTLLVEALLATQAAVIPVRAVAELVGEPDTRLWRVIHYYVEAARSRTDLSELRRMAVEEVASRRRHNDITLFADVDRARVAFVTEGKDTATALAFAADPMTSLLFNARSRARAVQTTSVGAG